MTVTYIFSYTQKYFNFWEKETKSYFMENYIFSDSLVSNLEDNGFYLFDLSIHLPLYFISFGLIDPIHPSPPPEDSEWFSW